MSITAPGVQLLGVNLSGAEYGNPVTGRLNYDYVYPTTSEIDYFASLGLNTIRIPVAWQRLQPTQDGPLSATQLAQLDTLVAYAASKGVTVDIDLHNYGAGFGAEVGSAQTPDSSFANFWSQIAEHYKNAPNVIFGLMNEPNAQTPAAWAVAAQDAVNAIRATGAAQEILVSGSDWDTASSWVSSRNAATVGEITDTSIRAPPAPARLSFRPRSGRKASPPSRNGRRRTAASCSSANSARAATPPA